MLPPCYPAFCHAVTWRPMMSDSSRKTYRPWEHQRYRQEAHSPEAKLPEGDLVFFLLDTVSKLDLSRFYAFYDSVFKFFQVDITGMFRMTSSARYFKEGVGSSRPNWRWIMCFLECPKANTSCRAVVKCCRRLWGASEDTKSSMTSTRHSTCTFALRLPTVYAGRLFLSWAS